MKFKPEQIKPLLEELKHADIFRIAYNAKKYNKMIIRHGVYDDNTRAWITKTDELAFTYYDLNQKGFSVDWKCYTDLGHALNMRELMDISSFITSTLQEIGG